MTIPPADDARAFRRTTYALMLLVAFGGIVGRIVTVKSKDGKTPFLSANDRSRWCTIRALGDDGAYEIDGLMKDRLWKSIDVVRHKGPDGKEHYYSSKPTLFPTLLAGEYWLINKIVGIGFEKQAFYVIRLMLLTINALPLAFYFVLLVRMAERYAKTHWGKLFVAAAALWGTFLTTFAVTLNNHLPAAISVLITVYAALAIWNDRERRYRYFIVAGLFSAFAAANELPALSFFALVGAALLWKAPRQTLIAFAPAAALVCAGFFGTNYLAHQSWRPAYAHRGDGQLLLSLEGGFQDQLDAAKLPAEMHSGLEESGIDLSPRTIILEDSETGRWTIWDPDGQDRLAVKRRNSRFEVFAWDNWYKYKGTYWTDENKNGVDRGEPSRAVYAFHVLLGHHGLFSLTPIWLLSAAGVCLLLVRRSHPLFGVGAMTALLTLVVVAFYIMRPEADRNYGGVTCGLRWLFWLTPLWLLSMIPVVDKMACKSRWKALALVFLFISVISASYASLNPWSHPWIFEYWTYLGWLHY